MEKRPTTHEVQINNNLFALEILLERLVEIKEKFNPEEIKDWSLIQRFGSFFYCVLFCTGKRFRFVQMKDGR